MNYDKKNILLIIASIVLFKYVALVFSKIVIEIINVLYSSRIFKLRCLIDFIIKFIQNKYHDISIKF